MFGFFLYSHFAPVSTIERDILWGHFPAFGTCSRCSCYSYCHQNVTGYGQPVKLFDPKTVTNKTIHVTVGYYFPRTVTHERRPSNHSDNFCVSFWFFLLNGNQSDDSDDSDDSATSFIIPPNGNQSDDTGSIFLSLPHTVTNQTILAASFIIAPKG